MGIFRKKQRKPKYKKTGGIFFVLLIPLMLFGSLLNLINLALLFNQGVSSKTSWALFSLGFITSFSFLIGLGFHRFRTFVHELKHAVVVVGTGNRLKEFHVDKHVGHVSYDLLVSKAYLAPIIILAPYFFPILSLPALIACVLVGEKYLELCLVTLGMAVGADIMMGYQEIHSNQSDLKRVFGGFLFAGLFIVLFDLFWFSFCGLWVSSGNGAYQFWAETCWKLVRDVFEHLASSF